MPLFRRKKQNNMGLMALAGETAKMAKNMMVLDKTEAALEREVEKEEKRPPPKTKIGKIRRRGEHLLHGKYLLLLVVVLNVVDCLLVLGELMLDIKYVTDLLTHEHQRSEQFIGSMKALYPARLAGLGTSAKYIDDLENQILIAHLTWDHNSTGNNATQVPDDNKTRKRRSSAAAESVTENTSGNITFSSEYVTHSIEEEVAHGLHKASITILGILVLENLLKIFCLGKTMLEHKLECFDCIIVMSSFIVDLVFIKGLQQFTVEEFVLILAFMVPWRIIRVVNSLVVAIMDHQHFRLVLLYKQKKKVSQELKDAKNEMNGLEACIDVLKKLCMEAGISETFVDARLNMYRKVKAKTNAMAALSSFAVGGDAMKKPFTVVPNGDSPNGNSVTTVDETIQAKKLESVITTDLSEDPNKLAIPSSFSNQILDLGRPRSHSAIEARLTGRENGELLRKLAENSASFIATINKDDVELREKIVVKANQPEKDDQPEGSHTSDASTTDSYESKTKYDTEALVQEDKKDNDDDEEDGGVDNLATQM